MTWRRFHPQLRLTIDVDAFDERSDLIIGGVLSQNVHHVAKLLHTYPIVLVFVKESKGILILCQWKRN